MGLEGIQDDDGRDGLHDTGCQSLGDACGQHQTEVARQTAPHAANEQQQHRAHIGRAVTVPRQQPGSGEHGHGGGHHEAGGDPLGALLAQCEVMAHVRDRHVDDGGRHDGGHGANHDGQQQQPPVALAVALAQYSQRPRGVSHEAIKC